MKITRHTPNCLASCKNGNICFNRLKGGNHEKKQRFLKKHQKINSIGFGCRSHSNSIQHSNRLDKDDNRIYAGPEEKLQRKEPSQGWNS